MPHWLDQLRGELLDRRRLCLHRSLLAADRCARQIQRGGRTLINLASNDYLALASHPELVQAAVRAAQRYGVGAGSSRLVAGHLEIHERFEARFAAFKQAQAGLFTPTGYLANLAAVTALAGPHDVVLLDKLCHASLIDAARLSGAQVRVFGHRNLDKLDRLLRRYRGARRRLIVTDAVFSMDGDCADLPALCQMRDDHGAMLIVDEAHAIGVLGPRGAGLAEMQGVLHAIDVTISTAGKALGCAGGIITGRVEIIEMLVNGARPFIYATAAPPMQVAAVDAALDVLATEPQRRQRLARHSHRLREQLRDRGWPIGDDPTPIVPLVVGDNAAAVQLAARLDAAGFHAPAIRPPSVPPGTARVRLSLRCDLEEQDVDRLVECLGPARIAGGAPA